MGVRKREWWGGEREGSGKGEGIVRREGVAGRRLRSIEKKGSG